MEGGGGQVSDNLFDFGLGGDFISIVSNDFKMALLKK